jgi:uncharacterized protein YciI/heme-degrading monooxygenase HmoA
MKHFLLFYDAAPDYLERRAALRDAHLEKAWASHGRGELQLGGALADPIDGAVLLFRGETRAVAESFARADPYVVGGLVTRWRVREWTTVAGAGAANPVQPGPPATTATAPATPPAIHRTWRARANRADAAHYLAHFRDEVAPALRATPGYLGAEVVDRDTDGEVEITVTTRWRSLEDIARFAGADPDAAVVQPAARALLRTFDARVTHQVARYRDDR